jgi:hypothetical protein
MLRRPQSTSGATLWRISTSAVTNFRSMGERRPCSVTMTIRIHRSSAVAKCPQTPRVTLPRDVTRISGPTLERARQAVEVLRQCEDPKLSLMGFVDAAVVRLIVEVETRYPDL